MIARLKSIWARVHFWATRLRHWPGPRRLTIKGYSNWEKKALIASLADHAGWKLLMADLETYRAGFERIQRNATRRIPLNASAESIVRRIMRLDEAITWSGWLQWRIKKAGAMPNMEEFVEPEPSENNDLI